MANWLLVTVTDDVTVTATFRSVTSCAVSGAQGHSGTGARLAWKMPWVPLRRKTGERKFRNVLESQCFQTASQASSSGGKLKLVDETQGLRTPHTHQWTQTQREAPGFGLQGMSHAFPGSGEGCRPSRNTACFGHRNQKTKVTAARERCQLTGGAQGGAGRRQRVCEKALEFQCNRRRSNRIEAVSTGQTNPVIMREIILCKGSF